MGVSERRRSPGGQGAGTGAGGPGGPPQPLVLCVSGSDCGGGAGLQADLLALAAVGVHGATAVTAVTVQGPGGVRRVAPAGGRLVAEQMAAVFEALPVAAVKVGMLATAATVRAVARVLRHHDVPVVVDPVLAATVGGAAAGRRPRAPGGALLEPDAVAVLREELLPRARLVTPNAVEAGRLVGCAPPRTPEQAERVGRRLLARGPGAVLVKGGHLDGDPVDVLVEPSGVTHLAGPRIDAGRTHGTGCALSAAIAAHLARGASLRDAVCAARHLVRTALAWRPGLPDGRLGLVALLGGRPQGGAQGSPVGHRSS